MVMKRKIVALGLAGCLTLGGTAAVLAQQSNIGEPGIAQQQTAAVNVKQIAPITVTSEKITANSELANIKIEYPVISGLQDEAYQAQLNNLIKLNVLKAKEEIEKEAAEYAQLAKQEIWEIRPYELNIDYTVKNKDDILSFSITSYTYTGGANGMQSSNYYNIDLKQNRAVSLADLFLEDSNYQEIINAEIKKQIAEEMATGEGWYFGMEEDSQVEGFKSISEDQAYYLEHGNLVIAFGKYEIAPGAVGEPTFEIPLADVKELLKEEYHTLVVNADPSTKEENSSEVDQVTSEPVLPEKIAAHSIMINDHQLPLEQTPIYVNGEGITMIPLRTVAENLGYTLEWNAVEKTVEVSRLPHWTVVREGQDSYFFARMAPFSLGAAPEISSDGVMYVPLAFVTEVLKAEVSVVDGVIKIMAPIEEVK